MIDTTTTRLRNHGIRLNIFASGTDFEFIDKRAESLFEDGVGFNAGRGLLVRPDQHILASVTTESDLYGIVSTHLGFN